MQTPADSRRALLYRSMQVLLLFAGVHRRLDQFLQRFVGHGADLIVGHLAAAVQHHRLRQQGEGTFG